MTVEPGSRPRDFLIGGAWPDGELAASAAAEVLHVRAISRRLRSLARALGGVSALAQLAKADEVTLAAVMDGDAWPSVDLLARIEAATQTSVWPRS